MTKEEILEKRHEFLHKIANDDFVKQHMINYTWTSGENTTVYPIQEWINSVDIQWNEKNPAQIG